jgi:hypothetical protein
VESLDEVIDAMIADRVIHRHRRKWLIAIAVLVALVLVVLATGGWKQKQGRKVPTLQAPATVTAGRYEFGFDHAEIVRTPKTKYDPAKAVVRVYLTAKNIDSEEHTSQRPNSSLLRLVPGNQQDLIESEGVNCRGSNVWVLVYGLPPEDCHTDFEVGPNFAAETVEVGVLAEEYKATEGVFGAGDDEFWQDPTATAVVQLKPKVVVEKVDNP